MHEQLVGALKKGIIFVISAPAGTGKTTLAQMLVDEFPSVTRSVSCTTRPRRANEIDGVDYHFLSKEAFAKKVEAREFLEHAEVFGNHYGTLKTHVEKKVNQGNHVLLIIDTQGALELQKRKYPAVYLFIQPPSMGELRVRLFNRKTEEKHHIEERLKQAEDELQCAMKYDYLITNDNLHRAFEILRSILISEEHKTERYHDRHNDE